MLFVVKQGDYFYVRKLQNERALCFKEGQLLQSMLEKQSTRFTATK